MMRWTTKLNDATEALARAQSMTRFGKYVLGAGGFHPNHADPQSAHWKSQKYGCDCSGFLFWCWGVSRKQQLAGNIEHLNTDWLVHDARNAQARVVPVEMPEPGDAVVYGSFRDRKNAKVIGHVGIVVSVTGGAGSIFERLRVIHCSAGNMRRFGYAIAETDGQAFNGGKDTIFVRPLP